MALRGTAARRYAQAVFDIAKESNSMDRWLSDLRVLDSVFGNSNATGSLEDPKLTDEDKKQMVSQHLPKDLVSELAMNLLLLLVQRGRVALLPRITELFQEMYNRQKGVVVADVTTAVPLDEAHQKRVSDQLSKITGGKTIELHMHEDPTILGGMITRIGDELIDASVAARLAELSERLS